MKTKSRRFRRLFLSMTPLAALVASVASPRPAHASHPACYDWCFSDLEVRLHYCESSGGDPEFVMSCVEEAFALYMTCTSFCGFGGDPGCDPILDAFCVPQDEDF